MGRRQKQKIDMGNAISIEDALSIMIVTFVLFIIFLIPLVTVEKDKLEKAETDDYWASLATWIQTNSDNQLDLDTYSIAFEIDDSKKHKEIRNGFIFIEALFEDGSITVIRHDKKSKSYVAMYIKGNSQVVSYRLGNIKWSKDENIWFAYNNSVDYGENEVSIEMQDSFRKYTKEKRGF